MTIFWLPNRFLPLLIVWRPSKSRSQTSNFKWRSSCSRRTVGWTFRICLMRITDGNPSLLSFGIVSMSSYLPNLMLQILRSTINRHAHLSRVFHMRCYHLYSSVDHLIRLLEWPLLYLYRKYHAIGVALLCKRLSYGAVSIYCRGVLGEDIRNPWKFLSKGPIYILSISKSRWTSHIAHNISIVEIE